MKKTTGAGMLALLAAAFLAGSAQGASCYVVPTNAAAAEPYDTWAKAATSIQTAVAYASAHIETHNTVIVSNGTYNITNQIVVASGITVRSFGNGVYGGLANASNTVVQGPGCRIFYINANATIEGFTACNGRGGGDKGGGVYMTGGLLRECIIRNNSTPNGQIGDGIYMTGGTVSNCVIRGNTHGGHGGGVGIHASGGTVVGCQIYDNTTGDVGAKPGGGVYASSAAVTIRNCLIRNNMVNSGDGGGVWGGTVENCTIVSNSAAGSGGGTYNSIVWNSIVVGNLRGGAPDNWCGGSYNYSCTWPKPEAGEENLDSDPLFVNPAAGDYHLQGGPMKSPCIDTGKNVEWMAKATDAEGNGRVFRDVVDRGALEYWPPVPMIRLAGVSKMADKTATVRCNVLWAGPVEAALFVCHGPDDGGTNRQAWANVCRVPGPIGAGIHEIGISHSVSNRTWCYRWFATNVNGAVWADYTGGLTLGAIEVKVTKRESTEEKPAEFVITRPATAVSVPLEVNFTLGGIGVNGTDYEQLDSPAIIPAGKAEIR
ncbi:MAG: choice-of-anchor Q domain-containing protein, partial [Kiritimatiellia bacterium]